jgi:hypothetical protein
LGNNDLENSHLLEQLILLSNIYQEDNLYIINVAKHHFLDYKYPLDMGIRWVLLFLLGNSDLLHMLELHWSRYLLPMKFKQVRHIYVR